MTNDTLPRRQGKPAPLKDKWFTLRNWLNLAFIITALAMMVLYFAFPHNHWPSYICCFAAIIVKMAEVCIRMLSAKKP